MLVKPLKINRSLKSIVSKLYLFLFISFYIEIPKIYSNENINILDIAEKINVQILTPSGNASGVLIRKNFNTYSVLTASHGLYKISDKDEIDIKTYDGNIHKFKNDSIIKIPNVDLSIINFQSEIDYELAEIGNITESKGGDEIYVFGFPLPNKSVENSFGRLEPGKITANSLKYNKDGYQILYTNKTLPGMSGGSILNRKGKLIGIHGRSEINDFFSQEGKLISTGTNMGIPISYYQKNKPFIISNLENNSKNADDFLVAAYQLKDKDSSNLEMLDLANKSVNLKPSSLGYTLLGIAKNRLGAYKEAKKEYRKAIHLNPNNILALEGALGWENTYSSSFEEANVNENIKIINKLIELQPLNIGFLKGRVDRKLKLYDFEGVKKDLSNGIRTLRQLPKNYDNKRWLKDFYFRFASLEFVLGKYENACRYYQKAFKMQKEMGTYLKTLDENNGYRIGVPAFYNPYTIVNRTDNESLKNVNKKYPGYLDRSCYLSENGSQIRTEELIYKFCVMKEKIEIQN